MFTDDTYNPKERDLIDKYDPDIHEFQNILKNLSKYYIPNDTSLNMPSSFSLLHCNTRSIRNKFDNFEELVSSLHFTPSVIGITESWLTEHETLAFDTLNNYKFIHRARTHMSHGGVGMFISEKLNFKERCDLESNLQETDGTFNFIEIVNKQAKNIIVGTLYRREHGIYKNFLNALEETLNTICNENKICYIMGDFNQNLLIHHKDNNVKKLLDCTFSKHIFPVITKPTRIVQNNDGQIKSQTLIDLIFTNDLYSDFTAGILQTDLSDHHPVFYIKHENTDNNIRNESDSRVPINETYEKRIINEKTTKSLLNELKRTDWSFLNDISSTNNKYDRFIEKLQILFEKHIPVKKVPYKQKDKRINKPWITKGIIISCHNKNKLYSKIMKEGNMELSLYYRKYRNILEATKRKSKRLYYDALFDKIKFDLKDTWKHINELLSKKKKKNKPLINRITVNTQEITSPSEIAGQFNKFFCSIGQKLSEKFPLVNDSPLRYLNDVNVQNSFYLYPTNTNEVAKIVKQMKNGLSTGHDTLNNSLLKYIIEGITDPLVHILNSSLEKGIFPDNMKLAKIIPLFKSGDNSELGNYRPISILPTLSKVLEKIVAGRLRKFLETKHLLYDKQFGFRSGHSTELAINHLYGQICKSIDKGDYSCGIFLDLSKAFDTVDTDILLSKMEKYGIRGISINWFKSYLSNRHQYVNINNTNSNVSHVSCGVPQGSILGPLLFLIYINDIHKSTKKLNFISFADDTTVYFSHKSVDTLIDTVNIELKSLTSWLILNKLTLNATKTKYIIFSSANKLCKIKDKYCNAIILNDCAIERVNNIKFLGVILNDNLKWDKQVNTLANKLSRCTGILNRLKHFLPSNIMLKIYNALVLPHLNYCIGVWGNTEQCNLERLFLLQKKAIRCIADVGFLDHTDPIFRRFKLLKIYQLFKLNVGKFMYKYTNKMMPRICDDYFIKSSDVHGHQTRQSNSESIRIPAHNTALFSKALSVTGPKIWNNIPNNIQNLTSLDTFKKKYKIYLCNQP